MHTSFYYFFCVAEFEKAKQAGEVYPPEEQKREGASVSYIGPLPLQTQARVQGVLARTMEEEPNVKRAIEELEAIGIDTSPLRRRINRSSFQEPHQVYRHILEYVEAILHCLPAAQNVLYAHPDPNLDIAVKKFIKVVMKGSSFEPERLISLKKWLFDAWSLALRASGSQDE